MVKLLPNGRILFFLNVGTSGISVLPRWEKSRRSKLTQGWAVKRWNFFPFLFLLFGWTNLLTAQSAHRNPSCKHIGTHSGPMLLLIVTHFVLMAFENHLSPSLPVGRAVRSQTTHTFAAVAARTDATSCVCFMYNLGLACRLQIKVNVQAAVAWRIIK